MANRPDPLSEPLWPGLRRLILFVLGVFVIVNAVATNGQNVGQMIIGTLLIGLIPVDELFAHIGQRWRLRRDDPDE
jgi:hypothetical protein